MLALANTHTWDIQSNLQQLSILLALIENLAAAGRCQRLRFYNSMGQPVGSLVLDSRSIQFGVELAGQPYIDPVFATEALPFTSSLIKHLHGEQLTSGESLLLNGLPLRARRAIRALTARAMRELALVCDLSPDAVQSDAAAALAPSALRVVFSPSEIMLAAGASGAIRLDDPAVIEFETPPLTPKERWLFVCPSEDPCRPRPVMTRLIPTLRVSDVVDKGRFCEQLIGHLPPPIPAAITPSPLAALLMFDSLIHYVVKTASYLALMIYPPELQRRLLVALADTKQRGRGGTIHMGESFIEAGGLPFGPVSTLPRHSPTEPPRADPFAGESPGPTAFSPVSDYVAESNDIVAPEGAEQPVGSAGLTSQAQPPPAHSPDVSWDAGPPDSDNDSDSDNHNDGDSDDNRDTNTEPQPGPADRLSNLAAVSREAERQTLPAWRPIVTARALHNPSMEEEMAINSNSIKDVLAKLESSIDGFIGAAIADSDSGMCLGSVGGGGILNLELAAAGNTEVVRAKRKAMKSLNLRDEIEDILITLGKQYHLIRPLRGRSNVFIYLALDRSRANLALARHTLSEHERDVGL